MSLHWEERIKLSTTLPRVLANRDEILSALRQAAERDREARSTGLALAARFPELEGIALLLRLPSEKMPALESADEMEEILKASADPRLAAALEAVFPPQPFFPEDAGIKAWARYFNTLARRDEGRSLQQRIESLGRVRSPELEGDQRTKALAIALETAMKPSKKRDSKAVSCLFAAWTLSAENRLEGPSLEQVLEADPDGFCGGVEVLFQMPERSPWEGFVKAALVDAWKTDGAVAAKIRNHLRVWLLYFWPSGFSLAHDTAAAKHRWLRRMRLQEFALSVLGHRPELGFLRTLCRYAAALFRSETMAAWSYGHVARQKAGFLLRWSYGETAMPRLEEIASALSSTAPEVEAAQVLAELLRQAELPLVLQPAPTSRPPAREEESSPWQPVEDLIQGRSGFLASLSVEEFLEKNWPSRIAELAGDPSVPDLGAADLEALQEGLGRIVQNQLASREEKTIEGRNYETWMPWLARLDPEAWMNVLTRLIEASFDYEVPKDFLDCLHELPALAVWPRGELATRLETTILRAIREDEKALTENLGLLVLMRYALHLEDRRALVRCLDALAGDESHVSLLKFHLILSVLHWVLDQESFETAGERRLKASPDFERRFWFFVELYFSRQLSQEEALAWWSRTLPTAEIPTDVAWFVVGDLLRIDDDRAAKILRDDRRFQEFLSYDYVQRRILEWGKSRQCLDRLEELFPGIPECLSSANRGTYLYESGRTEELRDWGHEVFQDLTGERRGIEPSTEDPLEWARSTLRAWAELEPEAFLSYVREISGSLSTHQLVHPTFSAFFEAVLLVWQQLAPLEAHALRTQVRTHMAWNLQGSVPLHVYTLWDTSTSRLPEHRTLRLQLLRSCPSDKDLAMHTFAARLNGSLDELDELADQFLASDAQLERVLGVSLLAWHPNGAERLDPLGQEDPSLWVRGHAQWGREIARRDHLGRELYLAALRSDTWLEQQARLQQLVPLVLPTFEVWAYHDEKLGELAQALPARRKALLIDFKHRMQQSIRWTVTGRDLKKYCRGEDLSRHLAPGDPRPPWSATAAVRPSGIAA